MITLTALYTDHTTYQQTENTVKEYAVSFKFETGLNINVEANSEAEAIELAKAEMEEMGVDHLPDMWPEDFVFDGITDVTMRFAPVVETFLDNVGGSLGWTDEDES